MYTYSFEKLQVWQLSRKFNKRVYQVSASFPKEELFGPTSQIRRAVASVCSNIAEGSSRDTGKDKAHFTTISFTSLMEVLNDLILACDLEFISETQLNELRVDLDEIANKLNALKKTQKSS